MERRHFLTLAGAVLALGTATGGAEAQPYPDRPITLIVPFSPGGATDSIARIVGQAMSETLGENIVVENVAGAGGTIGLQRFLKSAPDGYTLLISHSANYSASASLYPDLGFDPFTDLEPVGIVADVPMLLAVSTASGVEDFAGLKQKLATGEVLFGHAGTGSINQFASILLLGLTGDTVVDVPYQGGGPANMALMAGEIDAVIDQTVSSMPHHLNKAVKGIAVSSPERLPQIPDVPTFSEVGLPAFDLTVWNALSAPEGTPPDIVARVSQALDAALEDDTVQERFHDLGVTIPDHQARSASAMRAAIEKDKARFERIITENGIGAN